MDQIYRGENWLKGRQHKSKGKGDVSLSMGQFLETGSGEVHLGVGDVREVKKARKSNWGQHMLVLECQAERVGIHQWKVRSWRRCLHMVLASWNRGGSQRSPGPAPRSKWTARSSVLGQGGPRQEGAMLGSNRETPLRDEACGEGRKDISPDSARSHRCLKPPTVCLALSQAQSNREDGHFPKASSAAQTLGQGLPPNAPCPPQHYQRCLLCAYYVQTLLEARV